MSRSGYVDDTDDNWGTIRWRGAVSSAIRGRRGQAFLREMLVALDALPEKRLIAHDFIVEGSKLGNDGVCALGSVGLRRHINMTGVDPEDRESVAALFDIPHALACEIMYINDEEWPYNETPEHRYDRVRRWVVSLIKEVV